MSSKTISQTIPRTILRLSQVIEKTGLSRSTIYKLVSLNDFAQKIKLSARTMGFFEHEVEAWLANRGAVRHEDSARIIMKQYPRKNRVVKDQAADSALLDKTGGVL